jgi:hypothetical protein
MSCESGDFTLLPSVLNKTRPTGGFFVAVVPRGFASLNFLEEGGRKTVFWASFPGFGGCARLQAT